MLVKGFGIETGEDEESRAEKIDKANVISAEQFKKLEPFVHVIEDGVVKGNTPVGRKLLGAYKIGHLSELPASKFDEALSRAESASK